MRLEGYRLRVEGLGFLTRVIDSGRGTTRAEDAQGTPAQSHISPRILAYKEKLIGLRLKTCWSKAHNLLVEIIEVVEEPLLVCHQLCEILWVAQRV